MFDDHVSGVKVGGTEPHKAVDYAPEDDIPTIWKLKRLGHSRPSLIETLTSPAERGVGFRSIIQAIDATTAMARKPDVTSETLKRAQTMIEMGLTEREEADSRKIGKTSRNAALHA